MYQGFAGSSCTRTCRSRLQLRSPPFLSGQGT
uniref:Uncharacterized protein n=1 Tax=Arundo donax TaxID=35708 RepID=A0A0A9G6Z9_ARUDO